MKTEITAKPFDESKYTWYKATKEMTFRTKKDHREVVKKGDEVGVREATSKKGMYRFILKKTGTGVVFTANEQQHDNIMKNLESASGESAGENLDIKSIAKQAKATAEKIFKGYKVSVSDINDETNSGYVEMVLKKNRISLYFYLYVFL
ncbi:MAG TPA: hypothetical protein V6C65_10145, partial [Allocoleopsis sp.]